MTKSTHSRAVRTKGDGKRDSLCELWSAVLGEATTTWIALHPLYSNPVGADEVSSDWIAADRWLRRPSTTWDLCEQATGRTKEYVFSRLHLALKVLGDKRTSVAERVLAMKRREIAHPAGVVNVRNYVYAASGGAQGELFEDDTHYGGKPESPKRRKPADWEVVDALRALHSQGMVWVGVPLLRQKLNFNITARRMFTLVERQLVEFNPATVAYRVKE